MLFIPALLLYKVFAESKRVDSDCTDLNCFSESETSSSEFECKPKYKCNRSDRNLERPFECKKCLGIFQQIEFLIVRNNNVDVKAVKENFCELSRAVAEILCRSHELQTKHLFEFRTNLIKFVIENFRRLAKEVYLKIENYSGGKLAVFNDANTNAVSTSMTSFTLAVNVAINLPVGELQTEFSNFSGHFHTSVTSAISGVAVSGSSTLTSLIREARRDLDKAEPAFRHEVVELLANEAETDHIATTTLLKEISRDDCKAIEYQICKYRDLLITVLENSNLRLFEVVKFLLDICREEITGEKGKTITSYQLPGVYPCWNNYPLTN